MCQIATKPRFSSPVCIAVFLKEGLDAVEKIFYNHRRYQKFTDEYPKKGFDSHGKRI